MGCEIEQSSAGQFLLPTVKADFTLWYSASAWCGLKGQRQINLPAQRLNGNDCTVSL